MPTTQLWNEAINGDFSDEPRSPTALGSLSAGDNIVTGALPAFPPEGGGEDGLDVFSFQVPDGLTVSAIFVTTLDTTGFSAGFTIFLDPGGGLNTSTSGLTAGENLFAKPQFGFQGPLTPGVYAFDLRAFGPTFGANAYEFKLVASPPNTAPVDLSLSNTTVNENVAAGTTVGSFSTTDAEGGNFSYALVSGTGSTDNAAFTIDGNQLKINASPDFETKSSYSIRVKTTDALGAAYEESLTINVNDLVENTAPTAVNDTATTNENSPVTINVLANDTDPNSDPLSLLSFTNPANGTVTRNDNGTPTNTSDDQLVYTPNSNYSGTDSFSYTISDGKGGTDTATVNLTVNAANKPPTAVNDSISAYKNTPATIAAATLLANDTDPDAGTTLKITSVSNATNGTVALNSSGDVVFTATNTGDASFQYTLSDGSLTSTATVAVSVGLSLNGSNGINILTGSDRDDLINGNGGADALYGNKGKDTLNGGSGNDLLLGGDGDDILNGGDSADALHGGKGNDRLTGGGSSDIFVFKAGDGSDTITDFTDGSDKIGLVGLRSSQLTISGSGSDTVIKYGSETLATLTGINSSLITAADFVAA